MNGARDKVERREKLWIILIKIKCTTNQIRIYTELHENRLS
jgi:hypothetical protein